MSTSYCCFGSMISLNPSPIKLMESTNIVITAPGVTHSHQLFLITSADFAALIIFPQVGISEGTPTPKKLKPASLKINPATLIDKETITGDKAFLKILLKIMRASENPNALQTST